MTRFATPPMAGVRREVVDVRGVPVSALVLAVPEPRAVVVALHGGGSNAAYFHDALWPRMSLLEVGAALGFTVVSLDRPGYGASSGHGAAFATADQRVELVYAALDLLCPVGSWGAGYFVVAHSLGCALAMRMAATERGSGLLGIELSGTGVRLSERAVELTAEWAAIEMRPGALPSALREIIWGPPELYPPGGGASSRPPSSPPPPSDALDWAGWSAKFPVLAGAVPVPVRYVVGDHERWWRPAREDLEDVASRFTASPRVIVDAQFRGGHNLSRGRSSTAYHLKVMAFVEECILDKPAAFNQLNQASAG